MSGDQRLTRRIAALVMVGIAMGLLGAVLTYSNGRAQSSASKADVARNEALTQQVADLQELAKAEADAARATGQVRSITACDRLAQLIRLVDPSAVPVGECPPNPPQKPTPAPSPS